MNMPLSRIISSVGEAASFETKRGRNAKKKTVNLGLSKLIAMQNKKIEALEREIKLLQSKRD